MAYDPKDVHVEVLSDTFYVVHKKTDKGMVPITIPMPTEDDNAIHQWTLSLDDTELEAARQIFWDRWNFQESTPRVKLALDALDLERKRRKMKTSTFAPGIFR